MGQQEARISPHPRTLVAGATVAIGLACQCGPTPPEEPPADDGVIGAPEACPRDDGSQVPLVVSQHPTDLPVTVARDELEGQNDICADTWCEGSFEWHFYDLRSDPTGAEQTMRAYQRVEPGEPLPKRDDASGIQVRGDGFVGTVLQQVEVDACAPPCGRWVELPRYEPCLLWDLRCELTEPYPGPDFGPWHERLIACGIALEQAVRTKVPEFPQGL